MSDTSIFKLQFATDDDHETLKTILDLSTEYMMTDGGASKDMHALMAGKAIRNGEYTRENLKTIFYWKMESFLYLKPERQIDRNTDEEISDALKLATKAQTTRAAISVLGGLVGVGVPVASAILTTIYPDQYTVVDKRALKTLGVTSPEPVTVSFYCSYLESCRCLAARYNVELRILYRALWMWPKPGRTAL